MALNIAMAERLQRGRYEDRTLYVLGDEWALEIARTGMDPARDLLVLRDRVWVLAPGWHARGARDAPDERGARDAPDERGARDARR